MVLTVLPALVVGAYLYYRLDDELRARVEAKIAQGYPGLHVRVRSAQFLEGQGIEIRGLSIWEPEAIDTEPAMLDVDELFVVCQPTLAELVQNQLTIQRYLLRRPKVRAVRRADGSWNLARMLPLHRLGTGTPETVVEDAIVEIIDEVKPQASKLVLREINFTIIPQPGPAESPASTRWAVEGSLAGDLMQQTTIRGLLDPDAGQWRLDGTLSGLAISSDLLAVLPVTLPDEVHQFNGLRAVGNFQFQLASGGPASEEPRFSVAGKLQRGRFDDPRLPYPLTDLEAQLRITNDLLTVDSLTARHGQTTLELSCQRRGLAANRPLALAANIRKLTLDPQMVARLPASLRENWNKFTPTGEVDVEARLTYDGAQWQPDITVRCVNVAFSFYKFPYRLERGEGTITYRKPQLDAELTAYAGDQPVKIHSQLFNPGPSWTGQAELRGNQIPVENRLIDAMPEKARRVIQSLRPAGKFDFYYKSWRQDPGELKPHAHLWLSLDQGTVQFEKFPYPLSNIRGTVEMIDGHWTFRDLEGTNGSGFVTCTGHLRPTPQGSELSLLFAGAEVPLEAELRDALTPRTRAFWKQLKPRGHIDLTAEVRYLSPSRQFDLKVRIEPFAETASIEPVAFPYKLEKLQGIVTYHNGSVKFDDLRAQHGAATIVARGVAEARPDQSWHLQFEGIAADRLYADRELLMALPAGLRQSVTKLNPTGPINMRGSFGLSKNPNQPTTVASRWDLTFNLLDSTLDCGIELEGVTGEVRLAGLFDGRRFQSRGELQIDSVTYKDVQLTEVLGPIWIDNDRILLGVWAERHLSPKPRRITAKVYDGTLVGDAWVALGKKPQYAVQAWLNGANLERYALESIPGPQKLKGKVSGNVELHGNAGGVHSLGGRGVVQVYDADIYELPVVVQLLKVLRVRAPDATAFTRSDMEFRVNGEHLLFDKLNLVGDAVSLYGKGEMGFDHEVRLSFHSVVGRNDLPVPLLQKFVGEASNQILQIHVKGNLKDPTITSEAFPAVSQALQQLQADLGAPIKPRSQQPSSFSLDPRRWFSSGGP